MALNAARALIVAQRQSFWNRLRRESGLGGRMATAITIGFVGLIVAAPGWFVFQIAIGLAGEMRAAPSPETLIHWNGLQAVFTLGFGLCGSFRYRPAVDTMRLGHFPIPAFQLLLAEIPAGMFEVFPLLGGAAIVLSNAGLVVAIPWTLPLATLLALQGLAGMLALIIIAAMLRGALMRHRLLAALLASAAIAVPASYGWEACRQMLRAWIPVLVRWQPGSLGYGGMIELSAGSIARGSALIALSLSLTAAFLALAAYALQHDRASARSSVASRWDAVSFLRFRNKSAGVAYVYARQLLDCKAGRTALLTPLLFSGMLVFLLFIIRSAINQGEVLPDVMVDFSRGVERAPVPVWSIFCLVLLNSSLWMNQFGWDRSGIRGLLSLPMTARELLAGKALGLACFTLLQAAICLPPLLFAYALRPAEAAGAAGLGITSFVTATGIGQYFSLRFPRGVARDGAGNLPLYLSWIPTLLCALLATVFVLVGEVTGGAGGWSLAAAHAVMLALSLTAYRASLPFLARKLAENQDRLLAM